MDLHAQIMNLPVKPGIAMANATDNQRVYYKLGHRDARHAAAELASAQSERIARLEEALKRIALAKPDRLDHSLDVAIIERAARIASDALETK